jgi:NADPH:quinone reductase
MKAIIFEQPGDPDVLTMQDWPEPRIQQPTEILIQLKAAGVNPIDTKLRHRGTFYPERMPAILGCDGAGIIVAVGEQARWFEVGEEVFFCSGGLGAETGTYAEYAVVDQRSVALKPKSLSFAEAAAMPLVTITAWEALRDRAKFQDVKRVLIHGGAGGVGHVAVQIAKFSGAKVCTTVSSDAKASFVKQLGAELAINYRQTDFVAAVLDWTEGEGVDLVLDTVGGKTFEQSFAATRVYGDVVTLLEPAPETNWKIARNRNLRVSFELMLTPLLQGLVPALQNQVGILKNIDSWINFYPYQFKVHLEKTFPLGAAADAHRFLEAGSVTGKVCLLI